MKKRKFFSLLLAGCMILTGLTGCNGGNEEPDPEETTPEYVTVTDENGEAVTDEEGEPVTSVVGELPQVKELVVGFIYSGTAGGDIANEFFEAARAQIGHTLESVKTYYVENVLVSQFEQATAKLVEKGCNVIISTSNRYANAVYQEASANKSVFFISFGGTQNLNNLTCFQGEMYKGSYVCGLAAAYNSENNRLGIVADSSVMSVYNIIDGFIQGTKELNDRTFMDVRLNWAWGSSDEETKAAIDDLIEQGCDIIFAATYSKYAVTYCEERGVRVIGMAYNMPELAPENYITGCFYNLTTFIVDSLRTARYNMGISSSVYMGGIKEGAIHLITFNENCREQTQEICDVLYELCKNDGTKIFQGEIRDTAGNVKVEKGSTLPTSDIFNIGWIADNVTVEQDFRTPTLDPIESELTIYE